MYNFTILAVAFLYRICYRMYVYYEKNKKKTFYENRNIDFHFTAFRKNYWIPKNAEIHRNAPTTAETRCVCGGFRCSSIIPRNTRIYTVIRLNAPRSGYAGGMRKKNWPVTVAFRSRRYTGGVSACPKCHRYWSIFFSACHRRKPNAEHSGVLWYIFAHSAG